MKKVFLIVLVSLIGNMAAKAQQSGAKSVYFELGGPGLASFNFDTRFGHKQDGLGMRVGFWWI
ncbi:MAG: hypothetical protein IPP79_07520 [Chitinophagaceae bacterium]|nr:hypothetical protein [Chitinophagaceae bacterium]